MHVNGAFSGYLAFELRRPLRKADLGRFRLRVDDRFALGVDQRALGFYPHVAAFAALARKLNEMLRILRCVEERAELLYPDPPP